MVPGPLAKNGSVLLKGKPRLVGFLRETQRKTTLYHTKKWFCFLFLGNPEKGHTQRRVIRDLFEIPSKLLVCYDSPKVSQKPHEPNVPGLRQVGQYAAAAAGLFALALSDDEHLSSETRGSLSRREPQSKPG